MIFYRAYHSKNYDTIDTKISYYEFNLIKETPCGYWIKEMCYTPSSERGRFTNGKKWIHKGAKNSYAFPTKEEALYNFYKRKERYIKILKSRLQKAQTSFRIAESEIREKGEKKCQQ
jgi:hypothetical protein